MLAILALGACGASPPGSAPDTAASTAAPASMMTTAQAPTMARYDGYGDMRFGMDEASFRAAWKGQLQGQLQGQDSRVCFYLWPKSVKVPADFAFMFEHGEFVRYDVATTKQTAPGGGKVGMSAARIHALYPDVTEQPHKYETGGKYLRVENPDGTGVLVFEVGANGKVSRWRAGVQPQVDYVEGCS
ncbi:hypothetical protein [Salinisphaera sp.]|uniref:hypothetical protein n=1 Tax=Salinisphaera sp. TaxID=1914330 RepID=UPI002D77BFE4|nr:hypothetical protein [Salinisphaera sp.]HET7313383.1 hypothetical protein [Salinisphaera sp.]